MKTWKDVVKANDRYSSFIILKEPVSFLKLFQGKDIPCVQLHSIEMCSFDDTAGIVGFCGSFSWINDRIKSLDGDSYTTSMNVYGYEWFDHDGEKCLDILVGEDW